MQLRMTELRVTCRATKLLRLPEHAESLFRGLIGRALRWAACEQSPPCAHACVSPQSCLYTRLFDPPMPNPRPHPVLSGGKDADGWPPLLPLVPPPGSKVVPEGGELTFGVRLVGRHEAGTLARVEEALQRLAGLPFMHDGVALADVRVTLVGEPNRQLPLYDGNPGHGLLHLECETPLWWESRKRLLTEPSCEDLVKLANRRLVGLSSLYGALDPEDESAFFARLELARDVRLVRSTLRPRTWERRSDERHEVHPMKGLIGDAVWEGPIGVLLPWFEAARLVLVGKQTSFGLGRVRFSVA